MTQPTADGRRDDAIPLRRSKFWRFFSKITDKERHDVVVVSLRQRLSKSLVETESGERFIPHGTFEDIIENDEQSVYQALQALRARGSDVPTVFEKVRHSVPKIFIILVLLGSPDIISLFLKIGIDDSYLPYLPNPSGVEDSREKREKWATLKEFWSEPDLNNFFGKQWSVLAPRFKRDVDQEFTRYHILPFLPIQKESRTGGFSLVRKVKIHPKHHEFGKQATGNSAEYVAVKKHYAHDEKIFDAELEALRQVQKFQNPHLVQLLTSFKIQEYVGSESGRDCFLVFPWAAGNLRDFWAANDNLVRDQRIVPWISEQCCGLATALALVHEGNISVPEEDRHFGIHADIKPENILWFPPPDEVKCQTAGLLALADFGLYVPLRQRYDTDVSSSSLRVTATYRPPEFNALGRGGRKMDIWMLGCTYLELVTWFLRGSKATTVDFRESRCEVGEYGIRSDTFFRMDVDGTWSSAELKPSVIEWVDQLISMPQCTPYLRDFLILITTQMLTVEPRERITASNLRSELKKLDSLL
ncbi:hypothetical protein NPX13_g1804 [Xylaria arbuscula]|uniref:Protein kinase domain-containing protein n=1 Tax=Xylaria arbuscula TaxID=114810 RepID=A0A9W8NKY6_9PEZI|nr:hypothetical protein NPX13_g1804 [Xylaria arbuscula]